MKYQFITDYNNKHLGQKVKKSSIVKYAFTLNDRGVENELSKEQFEPINS